MSHFKKPTDVGTNRTGLGTAPGQAREMVEGSTKGVIPTNPDSKSLFNARLSFSRTAPPVGTMPAPTSLKGIAKTVLQKLKGNEPLVFLDKVAERLAFERGGARLYEALLVKFEASRNPDPSITALQLLEIRDDEIAHAGLCMEAIELLGSDPTVVTPSADIIGVTSLGFVQAVSDARTTFTQALEIALIAELADNASWELLVELARGLELDDVVESFRGALVEEQRHLEHVRAWYTTAVAAQAGVEDEARDTTTP